MKFLISNGIILTLKKGFITVTKTKSGKDRKIPISSTLKPELKKLHMQRSSEYVFVNPLTKKPYYDLKRSFPSLCKNAQNR